MSNVEMFQEEKPSLESYWRSIILFGRNVASYKFALSKSLLEIAPTEKNVVTLEELAEPFSRHLCEHLRTAPKQVTSNKSQFIEACREYNSGEIDKGTLVEITKKKGFNNVIDAFHVVNAEIYRSSFMKRIIRGDRRK